MNQIILSRLDYSRIQNYINDAHRVGSINVSEAKNLISELNGAKIVEPEEIPGNVVTMNSIVKISFIESGKQIQFQIVYPAQANLRENKISIFSPIATALIGYAIGNEIEWIVPTGPTKIRIDDIIYQPEAAGDYHL